MMQNSEIDEISIFFSETAWGKHDFIICDDEISGYQF